MSQFKLDNLRDDAAKISAWIEISARKAARDPEFARKHGIVAQQAMSLFTNGQGTVQPVDWLRGAVTALLPRGWAYRIEEDTSGRGVLVLTEFQGKRV
jgi:hypothetical protein